jgi:hypothetical protein
MNMMSYDLLFYKNYGFDGYIVDTLQKCYSATGMNFAQPLSA